MTFQTMLKKERAAQGLTLSELETRSGVSDSSIFYYENGGNPTIDKADAILKALGKTMTIGEVERNREMTDREAIELTEARKKGIWVYENANIINAKAIRDELKPLLDRIGDLLQEREERKKGCMWCYRAGRSPKNWKVTLIGGSGSAAEGELFEFDTANCCPMCGKPLKEDE